MEGEVQYLLYANWRFSLQNTVWSMPIPQATLKQKKINKIVNN